METVLSTVSDLPLASLGPGEALLSEGARSGKLYVLKSGDLEVVRDGSVVATLSEPGDIIGEMSVLLDTPHSATVRSRSGAELHVIEDPTAFLDTNPAIARHVARTLAARLHNTTAHLIDMRRQAKAHEDHEMFDKIFALLR